MRRANGGRRYAIMQRIATLFRDYATLQGAGLACRDIFLDVWRRAVYSIASHRKFLMNEEPKGGNDEHLRAELAGKITLAMARAALRELGVPADKDANAARLAEIAEEVEWQADETAADKMAAASICFTTKDTEGAAKLTKEACDIIRKGMSFSLLASLLKAMSSTRRPVPIYLLENEANGERFWNVNAGGITCKVSVEDVQLEAFKKLLPKTQKPAVLPYTPEVMRFSMACKQKPRIVEGTRGGIFEEEVLSGKYYDVIPDKARPDEVMSYIVGKEMALNSRMFPLLVFLLSLFYEQNRRLIARGPAYRQKTQKEDIKRKFTLKYADIVKRFAFNESKSGQSRAKQMIQRAAGTIINMKVDYRYTENGVPKKRVTNIFDEVESECQNNTWLTASFSEAYAERLVREANWVMFWVPVLKLRPDHVAPFLVASAKSIPSDGSRWRTSDLQEIVRYLGSEEGDKVHDSFHEDVVQKVHDFIRDAEGAGLASFRFMQRKADGALEDLTDEQARFIDGREPCGVRHSWNDLDGIVLQAKILDLPGGEKSIEEDEKQILANRKKRRAEKEAAS